MHYLDDFLTISPHDSPVYANNLQMIKDTCSRLGIPLSIEKIKGSTQCLTFLGITLDTKVMQAHLPEGKLGRLRNQVTAWLPSKKATKREILSLVGLLQHAVAPGKTFVSRMYKAAACLKRLSHTTRLTTDFHSDLRWCTSLPHVGTE